MIKTEAYLQDLSHIRSMMERSSRFISLTGLSGVMTGLYALLGAAVAGYVLRQEGVLLEEGLLRQAISTKTLLQLVGIGATALLLALGTGVWLTLRKGQKTGQSIWDQTARRLLISLLIPLVAGGLLCLIFMSRGYVSIVAPTTLIFYGMALVNGNSYTLHDIRSLGLLQIGLGLLAALYPGWGLLFWALGFGVFHIAYGLYMYYRYERE